MRIFSCLALAGILAGCVNDVPVTTDKLTLPAECAASSAPELPPVPPIDTERVGPDGVNKHWARHWRLSARPAYRRLRRIHRICSTYAKRS